MPRRDGTGPFGEGMLTGRGMGPCAGVNRPRFGRMGYGFGCGPGWGRGLGRFGGFWFGTEKEDKEILKEQRDFLKSRLDQIEKELEE